MLRPTSRAQWPTTTGSNGKHPGYRAGSVSILLLLVVAELSATSRGPVEQGRRRQRSHHRYAGEHIHVGSMFDSDCPVKPPCYCTDSVTTSQKASSGTKQWTADLDHRDDVVLVVAQRIACDEFPEVRRPRRKWSQRPGSKAGSRSRPRTRFPRFVESNVAVKRHVLLSYSGLTAIPGAAFHALKVALRLTLPATHRENSANSEV